MYVSTYLELQIALQASLLHDLLQRETLGVLHLFRCLCQLIPLPLQHVIHNLTPRKEPWFFNHNCDQRAAPLTKTGEQKYNEKTPQVEFLKDPCCLLSCFPSRVWKVPRSNRCSSVNIGRSISFHMVSMSQQISKWKGDLDFLVFDLCSAIATLVSLQNCCGTMQCLGFSVGFSYTLDGFKNRP